MEQDIERSKVSLGNGKASIRYPAVVYVESPQGNISPVVVINGPMDCVEHVWGRSRAFKTKRFEQVRDVLAVAPNSQSESKLFFLDDASPEDIKRVLEQAKQNMIV